MLKEIESSEQERERGVRSIKRDCVCVSEREREREKAIDRKMKFVAKIFISKRNSNFNFSAISINVATIIVRFHVERIH